MRWWQIRKRDSDLERELQADLELEEEEQRANGASNEEARYAALRAFGNPTLIREQTRAVWSWNWLEAICRDLQHSARRLRRSPGFTAIAVTIMALGIGANVAFYTMVRSVLLRPLPFPEPNRLVALSGDGGSGKKATVAAGDFYDWQNESHSFEHMSIWRWSGFNVAGDRDELPEFLQAGTCSWTLFPTLGVQPALGRTFDSEDDAVAASPTVVLSWGYFKRRFNADKSILGKTIRLNAEPYTVVGVLPESFTFPDPKIQLWVPFHKDTPRIILHSHYSHNSHVIARLKPGVSMARGAQEVNAVQHRIATEFGGVGPVASGVLAAALADDIVEGAKEPLYLLMIAVACLLCIACLNLSNLLVARAVARRKEIATRAALGCGRMRLLGQQLIESVLICLAGGLLGIAFAAVAVRWLTTSWLDLPRVDAVHVDVAVLAFAVAITFIAGILSGLFPAILFSGAKASAVMREKDRTSVASTSRASLRVGLLIVELALTVVLLVGAGLLFKSFLRLGSVDIGCTTRNVLTMKYFLRGNSYLKPEQIVSLQTALLERIRQLPGVSAAGLTNVVPGDGVYSDSTFTIPEHPPSPPEKRDSALVRTADPGYFQALQIPLLEGRLFSSNERLANSNFVIISQKMAQEFFPNEDPVGKHIAMSFRSPSPDKFEIIGVVGDTLYSLNEPARSMMWFPILSGVLGWTNDTALVVRSASDPTTLAIPIQKAIAEIDHDLPVSGVLTMQEVIGRSTSNASFEAALLSTFATQSLLLAGVGLFGVLSYLVAQRTSEIGVRLALGATREHVLRRMLIDGLRPAIIGLIIGLVASAVVTREIRSLLFGIGPFDPGVFASVAFTLLLVAALASVMPAWRASRLDPMLALRAE